MRNIAISLNLIIALLFVGSCGPTVRQKAITTAYATTLAIQKAEEAYSAEHQLEIVKIAPDKATAEHELNDFLGKRAELDKAIAGANTAIAAAAALTDDPTSMTNMQHALQIVLDNASDFLPDAVKTALGLHKKGP